MTFETVPAAKPEAVEARRSDRALATSPVRRIRMAMWIATVAAVSAALGLAVAHAQGRTSWDGVYSAAQAKRGEGVYTQQCATCHGADLKGKEDLKPDPAPSLTADLGLDFNDLGLDALADRIRTTMPKGKGNSLTPAQVTDLVSYILSKNGMPAGKTDLPATPDGLKAITYRQTK